MGVLLLLVVLVVLIVLVGCGLRFLPSWWNDFSGGASTGAHPSTWSTNTRGGLLADELSRGDDYLTSPIYSHLPGNIFYSSDSGSGDSLFGDEIGGSPTLEIDSPDYITDPQYSYMLQNIFHTDDLHTSGSDPCDLFGTGISSCDDDHWRSSFDDSCTSSSFDDSWSNSSFDDNWGGGSSFDD